MSAASAAAWTWVSAVQGSVLDAASVISPRCCAGCGRADRAVCADCRAALVPVLRPADRAGVTALAAFEFSGVAATVIVALKEARRTDAAGPLVRALEMLLRAALQEEHASNTSAGSGIELVVVPSSRASWRARGFHPVEVVLAAAGLRSSPVLRRVVSGRDQAGLSRTEREANMVGALAATRRLDGRRFLLVDDILTTGATAREVIRAIEAAGGSVPAVLVWATTRRRQRDTATR